MLADIPKEFRNYQKNCISLQRILRSTRCAIEDNNLNPQLGAELNSDILNDEVLRKLELKLQRIPTLLVFGQNCHSKALFVNNILEQPILPENSNNWRHISFIYGSKKNVRLTLGNEYEILDNLQAHNHNWDTIPEDDIKIKNQESILDHCPTLEVLLSHPLLKQNVGIAVPPICQPNEYAEVLKKHTKNLLPIVIYTVSEDTLNESNIQEIKKLKDIYHQPFLFIHVSGNAEKHVSSFESLPESEKHIHNHRTLPYLQNLQDQLSRLGYLNECGKMKTENKNKPSVCFDCSLDNTLSCDTQINEDLILFIQAVLKTSILKMAGTMSEIHTKSLRKFILCAFDMAREIQITPKRILYSQEVELKLYQALMKIACDQQEEITKIIQKTLQDIKSNVVEVLEDNLKNGESRVYQNPKIATMEIQQLVLKRLSNSVAHEIVLSVGCLQESFTGTLQRCLENLEKHCQESGSNLSASDAVKQILSAAYNIDLQTSTSSSIFHNFVDRLRMTLANIVPWHPSWLSSNQDQCNLQWQLQVVTNMIDSLSASKLAKNISLQFQESVKSSHEAFQSAIRSLESQLSGQLEQTEEQRIIIRKKYAPKFAKLALESTSLCDLIQWGMPKQIKEIGRGQYGVVSSCEPWGGVDPCALKSVVPPDDRHWNDLAMEFYYTRSLPEHPRIVKIKGSVIDYTYGGGSTPAVLLMMERMTRDLYCGLNQGLPWPVRLRIAIDVVKGIRYLHSQGLVHRDIKLKNVLLDKENRAKLTDFGFCIPEAMMSGSVVGTPVHMAPELLSGRYNSSVDVYAFGILFWYICAGQVTLPTHFNQFHNKEQLWNNVRKGIRPECLKNFDLRCWNLMEQCWAAEPSQRPLLGDVQPQLEAIFRDALADEGHEALVVVPNMTDTFLHFSYIDPHSSTTIE